MQGHRTHVPPTPEESQAEQEKTLVWLEGARKLRMMQTRPAAQSLLDEYAELGVLPSCGKRVTGSRVLE